MTTYNARISYEPIVRDGPAPACNSTIACVAYMNGAFDEHPTQESFYVILLNRRNKALGRHLVTLGVVNQCLAHPREVFRAAIVGGASAIVCAHNHPSGDPAPSAADISVTRQLREAAAIIGIDLLDHVVIGDPAEDASGRGYYSFREAGLL